MVSSKRRREASLLLCQYITTSVYLARDLESGTHGMEARQKNFVSEQQLPGRRKQTDVALAERPDLKLAYFRMQIPV